MLHRAGWRGQVSDADEADGTSEAGQGARSRRAGVTEE